MSIDSQSKIRPSWRGRTALAATQSRVRPRRARFADRKPSCGVSLHNFAPEPGARLDRVWGGWTGLAACNDASSSNSFPQR